MTRDLIADPHARVIEAELWAIAEDLQERIDALMAERADEPQPQPEPQE